MNSHKPWPDTIQGSWLNYYYKTVGLFSRTNMRLLTHRKREAPSSLLSTVLTCVHVVSWNSRAGI